jgi:autotransporter-associated beta strand protein
MTVPNGPADTATFGFSNKTSLEISTDTEVNGIVFTADATDSYRIDVVATSVNGDVTLTISGSGITNNSGSRPSIHTRRENDRFPEIVFRGSASAANAYISIDHGDVSFFDRSTADSAIIEAVIGGISFSNSSSAGGASIFTDTDESQISFSDTSTAGNASIGTSGSVAFSGSSSAGSAGIGIIASPSAGFLFFFGSSTGDTAQIGLSGSNGPDNALLYLGSHNPPGVKIGSLAGDEFGVVFLGGNNLTVGSNSLNTTFSGSISGNGGSLTKTGSGKLTLMNAGYGSDYTGGTTIKKGILIVNNTTGSATGTGPVQVISGTLSGTGIIGGSVTVGNGTTAGAIVRGGSGSTAGTLRINSSLTFNSQSTYNCYLNRTTVPKAGTVKAVGVTINANVRFTWVETGGAAVARGTKFRVIDNTSANPIFGRFSNLPDNSTFSDTHGTTFKVSYTGGTGNDLVLTVQ